MTSGHAAALALLVFASWPSRPRYSHFQSAQSRRVRVPAACMNFWNSGGAGDRHQYSARLLIRLSRRVHVKLHTLAFFQIG